MWEPPKATLALTGDTEERIMDPRLYELMRVRRTLAPEEWHDVKIYWYNDVEFEPVTLIATQASTGTLHYYDPTANEFKLLILASQKTLAYPTRSATSRHRRQSRPHGFNRVRIRFSPVRT